MHNTYRSVAGVCNAVFTIAAFILIVKFGGQAEPPLVMLMFFGCLLFPIIQPAAIYLRAVRQVAALPQNMKMSFDDHGMHIETSVKASDLKWEDIKSVTRNPHMIVIHSGGGHGFMLPVRMLDGKSEELFIFLNEKVKCML